MSIRKSESNDPWEDQVKHINNLVTWLESKMDTTYDNINDLRLFRANDKFNRINNKKES